MEVKFNCGCIVAGSDATTDEGKTLYANWDACEDHGDGYVSSGFALLIDMIADLRAALKTSQDYGEDLAIQLKCEKSDGWVTYRDGMSMDDFVNELKAKQED